MHHRTLTHGYRVPVSAGHTDSRLEDGDVHVWLIRETERPGSAAADFHRRWLSDEERRRADAFVLPEHTHRFASARAWLRRILGHYLARDPASLVLLAGPHGKPCLASRRSEGTLFFNASHSGDVTLVAVTRLAEVGIDVERRRAVPEWRSIARACFPREDCLRLELFPAETGQDRFFDAWTLYEARLKALGQGLGGPDNLATGVAFGTLVHWNPLPGYTAALALAGVRARARRIMTFRCSHPLGVLLPGGRLEAPPPPAAPTIHDTMVAGGSATEHP